MGLLAKSVEKIKESFRTLAIGIAGSSISRLASNDAEGQSHGHIKDLRRVRILRLTWLTALQIRRKILSPA